jgi:hypothetical protein
MQGALILSARLHEPGVTRAKDGLRTVDDLELAENIRNMTPQQLLESPHSVIGSVDQISERLQAHRERYTCSYFVIHDHNMEQFAPIVARLTGM